MIKVTAAQKLRRRIISKTKILKQRQLREYLF
jgi:hypothetical protein